MANNGKATKNGKINILERALASSRQQYLEMYARAQALDIMNENLISSKIKTLKVGLKKANKHLACSRMESIKLLEENEALKSKLSLITTVCS